jgi:mRNA interferase MazF
MRAGEIVDVDFGVPAGSEPGFRRPAIVVTADLILAASPRTVHVVPLTGNVSRSLPTEVPVDTDGLDRPSAAQCHLCTVVSTERITRIDDRPVVGPTILAQVRAVLGDMLDIP